jgi:bifunctional UDP-N-acetylglucosamine pyrophosphorylase / glucosamine-1-phosphate N-acetyltransferase
MGLTVVVLAAGEGRRMRSQIPKVMHYLAGKPIINHVIRLAQELSISPPIVITGHRGEEIRSNFPSENITWVDQKERLGTGHAVAQALKYILKEDTVVVLYGDVPLLRADTLMRMISSIGLCELSYLTTKISNPKGYGRIVRDSDGKFLGIVEDQDADEKQLAISEINTGIVVASGDALARIIPLLAADNSQEEYYLTDCVKLAHELDIKVGTHELLDASEAFGINDQLQRSQAERIYQRRYAETLMSIGTIVSDPDRIDVRGVLKCGNNVSIDINVVFEGNVILEDNVKIGPNCLISNSNIGKGTEVLASCVLNNCKIGEDVTLGPFAHLRPGTSLENKVKVGNFVEIKNSNVGAATKINHLSYIGDSEVGKNANLGAGTITCNYDGANKHKTVIGDEAFIGSGSMIVAPITIGKNATIAAGTTITKDVAEGCLAMGRVEQGNRAGWQRPKKK